MKKVSIKTNPTLWKSIVKSVKAGSKGGKPGQWSARKAQLAVSKYKSRGGGYKGPKSKNNSLSKWSRQKWRTRSGKNSVVGKNATGERYLPEKAIKNLSKKEYNRSSRLKRRSIKKGKQYSRQPKNISRKVKKYRSFGKGIYYKGYLFKGIKKSTNSKKKYMAIFEKNGRKKVIHFGAAGMSDYTKHKDPKRKERYMNRHRNREKWSNLMSAGALSRWILWNKPTLQASINDYKKKLRSA